MTVKELIEKLKEFDQNANVRIATDDGYWPKIDSLFQDDATDDVLLVAD